jgi:heterodisulfide reductase subunit A-like polyferredoxin
MKPSERLRDYTSRFFENCNTCVGVCDDQVVDSYKKGLRDRKVFEKIHDLAPRRSRRSWRSSTS